MAVLLSSAPHQRNRERVAKLAVGLSLFFAFMVSLMFGLRTALVVMGYTLFLMPFLVAMVDSGFLGTFRAGGALDELRQTRMDNWSMVDGTVEQTLRWSIGPVLKITAVLSLLALAVTRPGLDRMLGLQKAFLWAPVAILLFWICGYLTQLMSSFSLDGGGTGMGATVAICFSPFLLVVLWWVSPLRTADPLQHCLLMVCGVLAAGTLARIFSALAVARVEHFERSVAKVKKIFGTRNRNFKPWNDNPIVMRECARDAGRIPGGRLGYLADRYSLALSLAVVPTFMALGFLSVQQGNTLPPAAWLVVVSVYFLVHPTRAAARISTALVEERERRTLESLAVTPMGREDFVDGWAQVGWVPRQQENLLAIPFFIWLGTLCQVHWACLLLVPAVLAINCVMGSYLGFALGTWAPSRRESSGDFGVFVAFGCLVTISVMGCVMGYHPALIACCLLAFSWFLKSLARNVSLGLVSY